MIKYFLQICIFLYPSIGFSQGSELEASSLYSFHVNSEVYFPRSIVESIADDPSNFHAFYGDYYSQILKRMDEHSLSDKYHGNNIIRLSIISAMGAHYTIRIEEKNDKYYIVSKKTPQNYRAHKVGKHEDYFYSKEIEYDSASERYKLVTYKNSITINGPINKVLITQKNINPISKKKTTQLSSFQWERLIEMLKENNFYKTPTVGPIYIDGHQTIIETHSEKGYYVVDRYEPEKNIQQIIDYILGLSKLEIEI